MILIETCGVLHAGCDAEDDANTRNHVKQRSPGQSRSRGTPLANGQLPPDAPRVGRQREQPAVATETSDGRERGTQPAPLV